MSKVKRQKSRDIEIRISNYKQLKIK